jgi:hypothetical protein
MTEEEALEMVRDSGWMLKFVPEKRRTFELCLEAVRQNGVALKCAPEDMNRGRWSCAWKR